MARLEILEFPDPRLRTRAKPVETFDDDLRALVDNMLETMLSIIPKFHDENRNAFEMGFAMVG